MSLSFCTEGQGGGRGQAGRGPGGPGVCLSGLWVNQGLCCVREGGGALVRQTGRRRSPPASLGAADWEGGLGARGEKAQARVMAPCLSPERNTMLPLTPFPPSPNLPRLRRTPGGP